MSPTRPLRPHSAMILAAGLGERMRPLTDDRPKALVEVAGRALIDHALARLEDFGLTRVVVNVHYRAEALERHLAGIEGGPEIVLSDEREGLLDTGGGVHKALGLLGGDPFFVINCDALWLDGKLSALESLARGFEPRRMEALLLLVDRRRAHFHNGPGDFEMSPGGALSRPGGKTAPWVFSGLQILTPAPFSGCALGPYSLNRIYDRAAAAGRLYGCPYDGKWFHVGTPEAVDRTAAFLEG